MTYRLDVSNDDEVAASFRNDCLAIRLPAKDVARWATTDQVSIAAEQPIEFSGMLSLLVEKDFKCLSPGHHREGEDDDDTFPHPEEHTANGC